MTREDRDRAIEQVAGEIEANPAAGELVSGRDPSAEEQIGEHLAGRLADFHAIRDVLDGEPSRESTERFAEQFGRELPLDMDDAIDAVYEYPLGVTSYRTFRIDLSTGGPGDWLEIQCSGDTPNYEPAGDGEHYAPERITYHFAPWFDHAERVLDGDDFAAAEAFARRVVPELID